MYFKGVKCTYCIGISLSNLLGETFIHINLLNTTLPKKSLTHIITIIMKFIYLFILHGIIIYKMNSIVK